MTKKFLLLSCILPIIASARDADNSSFQFDKEQVASYNKSSSYQMDGILEFLDSAFFSNAENVLDLGCGDGKITSYLAKKMPKSSIVGCDVSKSMIDFAKAHYASSELPNLRFIEKSACDLGYSNEFDRVVSFNSLHWIQDQQKALNGIYTSLKSGGKALLIAATKSKENDLLFCCGKLVSSEKWAPHFQNYPKFHSFHSEEEYRQLLQTAGFAIDKIQESIREVVFENRKSFENWISSVLTPMHHLQEMNRKPFLNDLFAEIVERGRVDESGKIHLHFSQIELLATKPIYRNELEI